MSRGMRLAKFGFDVVHSNDKNHQVAYILLKLKYTGTNQAVVEDRVPVLCLTALGPPPRKRRGVGYVYVKLRHTAWQR